MAMPQERPPGWPELQVAEISRMLATVAGAGSKVLGQL